MVLEFDDGMLGVHRSPMYRDMHRQLEEHNAFYKAVGMRLEPRVEWTDGVLYDTRMVNHPTKTYLELMKERSREKFAKHMGEYWAKHPGEPLILLLAEEDIAESDTGGTRKWRQLTVVCSLSPMAGEIEPIPLAR